MRALTTRKLKTPWRGGTTHLVMSPLEFVQRLGARATEGALQAPVPRPRLHLIRFHGALAPSAKLRPLVVPVVPQAPQMQDQATEAAVAGECELEPAQAMPDRISWARLLKRVFDIDMHTCPNCGGGELKITAAILERPVIEKILTHLGLDPHVRHQTRPLPDLVHERQGVRGLAEDASRHLRGALAAARQAGHQ